MRCHYKIIVFCALLFMIPRTSALLPSYSVTIVEKCLEDLSLHMPTFMNLKCLLIPFLTNLLNNLNNLSNIVQNLTPAMLQYFGCTLPLLNSALSDVFSILLLYVGTAVSLASSGMLLGPGVFGLVVNILGVGLGVLKTCSDPSGLLVGVCGKVEEILDIVDS